MSIGVSGTTSGFLPTTTTTSTTGTTSTAEQGGEAQLGEQLNIYTPQQQALQGQVLGGLGGYLSGSTSVPANFGLPEAARQAAWHDFQRYQMPQLAAQYGSGSPAIGSQMQELQLKLAALDAQRQQENYQNAYRIAGEYAFRPVGATSEQESEYWRNILQNLMQNQEQTYFDPGGALGFILNILQNGIPAPGFL